MSLDDSWNDIRADKNPLRWMITKANEKATSLEFVKSGSTGFSDFIKELNATNGVVNAVIRIAAVDQRGAVRSIRFKFVRVIMITSEVSAVKRAKAANVKAEADNLFNGTHATFDISEADELTTELIQTKLHNSAGAHQPNHYEFEELDVEDSSSLKDTKPRQEKEATVEVKEDEKNSGETTPKKEASTPSSPKEEKSASPEMGSPADREDISIADAWNKVLDDKEKINWIVTTYDGKKQETATLVKAGCGDLKSFKDVFDDSKVMYGGFRCSAIDDSGSVKSVRAKAIFVSFIGPNVKPLVRAKAGSTRGYFEGLITGCHISVDLNDPDDLIEEELKQKLQSCAGAHKPNGYDFSGKKRFDE